MTLRDRIRTAALPMIGLVLIGTLLAGCAAAGYAAAVIQGPTRKIEVPADYLSLDGKSVAVMISADDYILGQYPDATFEVNRAITQRLSDNLPGARLMNPKKVSNYQELNPYWSAVPYGELTQALEVDRIVYVDLIEYHTHDPGNAHVWNGVIAGTVYVIERDADDPDNPTFARSVRAQFPERTVVGVIDADERSIQVGMQTLFSRDAAGLFYDHVIEVPR